jgi:hypothetical protein
MMGKLPTAQALAVRIRDSIAVRSPHCQQTGQYADMPSRFTVVWMRRG